MHGIHNCSTRHAVRKVRRGRGFDKNAIFILTLSHDIQGHSVIIGQLSGTRDSISNARVSATNLWALTYRVRRRFVIDCRF